MLFVGPHEASAVRPTGSGAPERVAVRPRARLLCPGTAAGRSLQVTKQGQCRDCSRRPNGWGAWRAQLYDCNVRPLTSGSRLEPHVGWREDFNK